jgi:hypothetical protein
MAKAKKSIMPAKKKLGRPSKQAQVAAKIDKRGDSLDPHVTVPLNKNELMLLGLAIREYRYQLDANSAKIPKLALEIMKGECASLEAKIVSNEVSWNSLYGNGEDITHIELV